MHDGQRLNLQAQSPQFGFRDRVARLENLHINHGCDNLQVVFDAMMRFHHGPPQSAIQFLNFGLCQVQGGFRSLLVINIGAGSEPANDAAFDIAQGQAAREKPTEYAVCAPQTILLLRPARLRSARFANRLVSARTSSGCRRAGHVPVASAVEAGSGVVRPALIDINNVAFRVGAPDKLRHSIAQCAIELLVGFERLLRGGLLGDVAGVRPQCLSRRGHRAGFCPAIRVKL